MRYTQLTLDSNAFNLGAILGTSGSSELYKRISDKAGLASSYFGSEQDPNRMGHHNFLSTVVAPINRVMEQFQQASTTMERPNVYRALTSIEDLKNVPPCMHIPIIMYPPVKRLLQEDRIEGYWYDPKSLPDEDVHGRLLKNRIVEIYPGSPDLDPENPNVVFFITEEHSTDPNLTHDELDAIETTRQFIDEFITNNKTCHLDPTNPTELKG